ncbi:CapA family protein [Mucilaginibacter sp. SP1R1]|uniref:CapA family protein n=1 Tax=Mucilaginibacter sp. SP1R1 TaxID=2723091 RepID=UPI00161CF0FC|nr:CapA family protein [Mucilaginibacter sp. SP1R1]MBB6150186.1 poly-gamma-glutamate capsule biosynthesis protein CapA/YwtB (metallophosphatase superfamily) [Mucilaginibacter sp. SP1R1]
MHQQKVEPRIQQVQPAPTVPIKRDSFCVAAVGDIMLGTSYPDSTTLPPDSARNSFKTVKPDLAGADITFGNLEGSLLDRGAPAHYKLHQKSKAYLFRMPTRYASVLKDAGFNVVSLANNHIGDFGENGRNSTIKTLDSLGIHYAGLAVKPSTVFEVNGIKYGFCSFAPNANTVSIHDLKGATQIISELKQRCDIVIVSFHGGGEGIDFEHVPCAVESYIGEKRGDVHAFAHNAIDAGADLIFGNGPHVNRAMEMYKNRLIAYSLGNFCTYKCVSVSGICGMAPLLKVYVNKKGEFLSGRIISFKQAHDRGLIRDTLNHAMLRIRMLTQTDFPAAGLSISDSGHIMAVKQN